MLLTLGLSKYFGVRPGLIVLVPLYYCFAGNWPYNYYRLLFLEEDVGFFLVAEVY